jgi:ketosteroid isomerase-like protein
MASENVEIAHRTYETYNRGDLDGFLAAMHPDVVWEENHPVFGFAGLDARYLGHDGVRRWWQETREMWTNPKGEINDIAPAGNNALIIGSTMRGTGAGSGIDVEMPFFHLFEFRDGKIARRRIYPERQEALEAVGLSE